MRWLRGSGAVTVALATACMVAVAVGALAAAPPARAGTWIQVSCQNPDGSAAPSDGWTSFTAGSPGAGANNSAQCGPGAPMYALLNDRAPAAAGGSENLEYQPPGGSKLVGGVIDAGLNGDGGGTASGDAVLYEPAFQYDGSDVFYQCAAALAACSASTDPSQRNTYVGQLGLPADRGGDLFVSAACGGNPGTSCTTGDAAGTMALAEVYWAHLLLSSDAAPLGGQFGGSALQPRARGIAHVVFTASDPGGPGVLAASAAIDGQTVWSGTPNTNGGACVPVGADSTGALMFDSQQPCPPTAVVDIPIPTAGLADGTHELSVTVEDAARASSTVLDQTITTSNPQLTPVAGGGRAVHARFTISWTWAGTHTRLRSISVSRLSGRARVSVRCRGRGCPRLRPTAEPARHIRALLRALRGKRFAAGDRLLITVTAPQHTAERIALSIRDGRVPAARLLTR